MFHVSIIRESLVGSSKTGNNDAPFLAVESLRTVAMPIRALKLEYLRGC